MLADDVEHVYQDLGFLLLTDAGYGKMEQIPPPSTSRVKPAFMLRVCLIPLITLLTVDAFASDVFFERDVRPILKAHCFQCHGEYGEKEGGLDLRLRRFIIKGGDSGPAVSIQDADTSLLLERVRQGEMPPGDDRNLNPHEVQVLERWIRGGAKTAREEPTDVGDEPFFTEEERSHWAFQPVERPDVPLPEETVRVRNPIDAFLLKKQTGFLDDAGPERLIRRASFDLVGLPPTPKHVDAFLTDTDDDAWPQLIDRLLASPQYGERWGRHWLDVAGYADSEGYSDEDQVRLHAWRYRDYVIRSFNADKPFDVFVQEQLAGDEMVPTPHRNLSAESIEKLTATGFLRMAPDGTAAAGVDPAAARNQVIADTLQIVGTALLGLTVNCAQCHDHRYDPIPTSDYYRLRAIFEPGLDWKDWRTPAGRRISLYSDADRQQAAAIEAEAATVEKQRLQKAEEYITRTLEEELLLVPEAKRDALRTAYRTDEKQRSDLQKSALKEYPSVASISVGSLYLYDRRRDERAARIEADRKIKAQRFVEAVATEAIKHVPAERREELETAVKTSPEQRTDEQNNILKQHPQILVTEATLAEFDPEAAAELERDERMAKELRGSKAAVDLKKYAETAAEIRSRKPVEGFLRSLTEVPGKIPQTFVFYRGDYEQPRSEVNPGDLSILPDGATIANDDAALPTSGRRLAFARHLTNGQHPLLARVIVNRIWMHHFGRGLVQTPGDFGVLGQPPTHPQLLDWLAAEFVSCGWSVKHMHRLIMGSTAYRQNTASAASQSADGNYVGYPIRRLESETIRDAILCVNGRLNTKQFGEPVPVMEDIVGQIVIGRENLDGERKPTSLVPLGGEEYRRSIYIQVRRTRTLSMFETFDAASVSPNCEQRNYSNATPQSLLMMNSEFAVSSAEDLAQRVISQTGKSHADHITYSWRLCFGTYPTDDELLQAEEFLKRVKSHISESDAALTDRALAQRSLAVFCQALLSSNRFLYVE